MRWPPAWPWNFKHMRHTLLPLPERIVLRREYLVRVLIVLCFVLSLAILVSIASLFPAFIRASVGFDAAKNEAAAVTKNPNDANLAKIQAEMVKSLSLLAMLSEQEDSAKISDLINGIVNMRDDIKLTSISASKESSTTLAVNLQGIAPTRDALLLFKKRFESATPGNKVDLPVSELAKSTDIRFSLQLVKKLP